MIELPDFLDVGLSDYLVNDLALSYDLTKNKLLARLNLYWLLEIQVKKLNYYYFPDKFQRSKGSHNVLGSIYVFGEYDSTLSEFLYRTSSDPLVQGRLHAIQSFNYVSARYSDALEVFRSDLPLVEDMFELYWILSNHLKQLGFS